MKKTVLFFVIVSSLLMAAIQPATVAIAGDEAVLTARVSTINRHELFANGSRYFIVPGVKVTLNSEYGREVSLKTVLSMGQIESAELHIVGNKVVKIVILEIRQ